MEHTQCISPKVDELLLEASLMYESANTSKSEDQRSTPKCRFAKPVTLEHLNVKAKKKQYACQNQTASRLELCFVVGMAFKPNKKW